MTQKKINVLHISGVGNWGGGENHIQNLCYELSVSRPEVKNIILCVEGGKFESKLKNLPIPYVTAKRRLRIDPRFIKKIIRVCKEEAIDLIHLHDPTAMQMAIIADFFTDLPPFILSRKISYEVKNNFISRYKYNYSKIKKYLCVSKETARVLSNAVTDKSKILTIYHGTRIDNKSANATYQLREKLGLGSDIKIVGNIANHYPAKDLPTLIRVVNSVVNESQRKNIHFVQIGSHSDQTPAILQQVEALGLEKYITFLGFTENASSFIPQFDVGLMSSQFEGIPQFIYECFYFRVPVVSTAAGGTAEIIAQGKTGFISEKGDDKSLSKQLLQLLADPQLGLDMAESAHEQLMTEFITPVMAEKTYQVYCEVLQQS